MEEEGTYPKFGSTPEDINAFNETIQAIISHNEQFNLGGLMARALIDHAEETQKVHELVDEGATIEEAEQTIAFVGNEKVPLTEEEQMARSIVGMTNAPVLEATGLTLSPLRETSTMFSDKGEQTVGRIRLRVTDGGKFSSFLLATNPEADNEDFQNNIALVVGNLIAETSDAIANGQDEQTAMETLAYGKGIIAGLEHIGLSDSYVARQLSDLVDNAQQGHVKEFVLAERVGLFQEPGEKGFGPSQWQRDATTQFMIDNWGNVISVLKMAKHNPNAQELFDRLLNTAIADLEFAKTDWEQIKAGLDDNKGYGKDYGSGFEEVFRTVELELKRLT